MDIRKFEQEIIKRKDWPIIRVVAYSLTENIPRINCIGELDPINNLIGKGKKISSCVKKWFIENKLDEEENINFEKVERK